MIYSQYIKLYKFLNKTWQYYKGQQKMASILSQSTNSNEQEQDVNNIIRQAYLLLTDNKLSQAIQLYQKCIDQHPTCWRAFQNIGVAYIMCRDYEKANEALKTYIRHVPRDPLGHDSLGVSYSQLDDPLQAIASFVNSINLSPTYYMSYYNLGVVLGKLNLYQYALNVYRHCLTLQPNYINAMNNIADILKKQQKIDQAIEIFQQVLQLDPEYLLGIKNLGNCYFAKQQYYQALTTYLKAGQIDHYHQSVLFNISLCLEHFGLYHEAANCAFKAYSNSQQSTIQSCTKTFITGNLFAKQMKRLNNILMLYTKFKKHLPLNLTKQFQRTYLQAVGCFTIACQKIPQFNQVFENLERTKLNFIRHKAQLAQAFSLCEKRNEFQESEQNMEMIVHLRKQKRLLREIIKWRGFTKRLVKQQRIRNQQKSEQFLVQRNEVRKQFAKSQQFHFQQRRFKSSSYLSRRFSHNLKRLIIKRLKFIRKYNRLNQQFKRVFRYKRMKATLSESMDNRWNEIISE